MREVLSIVGSSYKMFFGNGIYIAMFIASILYFIIKEKEQSKKKFFMGFLLLFGIIYVCPLTAYIIMEYCIGNLVYWRMFWILPITVMIAYAITKGIFGCKERWKKCVAVAGILLLLMQSGTNLYAWNFQARENAYKLDLDIVMVCDAIEADAERSGIEEIGVIGIDEFAIQARQYSAVIRMPYGRNGVRGEKLGKRATKIYQALHAEKVDAKKIAKCAKKGKYQYLVYYAHPEEIAVFEEVGYELVNGEYGYYIFKLS